MEYGVYYIPIVDRLVVMYNCGPQYVIIWFGEDYYVITTKLFKTYNSEYLGEY